MFMAMGSPMDGRPWLDELRQRCGCGVWSGPGADREALEQLDQALPLLMMLVARLRSDGSAEALGEVRHSWQKALRRRGWHALPSLEGGVSQDVSQGASQIRPVGSWSAGPTPRDVVADVGYVARQVAAFLSLFGLPLTVDRAQLSAMAALTALVDELLPQAQALHAGPLRSPADYARTYEAIVARWNAAVQVADLRVPSQ